MSSAVILSIKPEYARRIMDGSKKIELRRSPMGLEPEDVILVYVSAPEQQFAFWFRVARVETLPVDEMWNLHKPELGIEADAYFEYFANSKTAIGLHIGEVRRLAPCVTLRKVREFMPEFVPPQGFIKLRELEGPYASLLSSLSTPLPPDVFPQQSLFSHNPRDYTRHEPKSA